MRMKANVRGVPGRHTSGCRTAKRGCVGTGSEDSLPVHPRSETPEGSGHGRPRRSEALRGHYVEKSCPWRTFEHGRHLLPESPNMGHGVTSRLLIIEEGNNEDFALIVQEPNPLPEADLSIDRGL